MRYSLERRKRIYAEGYGFLSLAIKFGDKCGKMLMDTATKTGIDAAKTASKRVVQKTAEATRDLIGNKITDKIVLEGKTKNKKKRINQMKLEKFTYHQKKDCKLLMML